MNFPKNAKHSYVDALIGVNSAQYGGSPNKPF